MKVEVLYVADCPSHPAAVQLVRDVLISEGVAADIREVLVADNHMAEALAFRGSPTIRVNGEDVAGESSQSAGCAVSCRLYPGSDQIGLPRVEWVRQAVRKRTRGGTAVKQGTGISASLGAIVSSIATISCCLPLGFAAALGAGTASAFFTILRPWLLGLAVGLIALGFWQQRRATQCSVHGRRIGLVLLWASVVVVLGMILFPQEIAALIADRFAR